MTVLLVSFLVSGAFIATALVQNRLRRGQTAARFLHASEKVRSRGH